MIKSISCGVIPALSIANLAASTPMVVVVSRAMKMKEIGALDVRNQCSGFIYAISVADQFIKTGMYKNILVVGSEKHSFGLDFSTRGRNVSVIFGDGAGAVVLQPTNLYTRSAALKVPPKDWNCWQEMNPRPSSVILPILHPS